MKKIVSSCLILVTLFVSVSKTLFAQKSEWVNQVIVVNGGKYEPSNPSDYVTVQSYNPVTQTTNVFNTIYTQSAQHAIIQNDFLYVAAQDSIVKYNIDTYQRVAAVSDSGLSRLYYYNNRIIVTKQWPVKRFFVEVLDANDLSLIARIQNVSGDCGEAVVAGDSLYVAVNGGYAGTEGKLAVINLNNWTLKREINLGPDAKGIWNLFNFYGLIYGVCRTPAGMPPVGYLTVYDYFQDKFENDRFEVTLGDGYGLINHILYVGMNHGVGSINLISKKIQDTVVIPDPGFQSRVIISSTGVDYVNNKLYLNIGNMNTFGRGVIASAAGDSIGSYPTGLSADAVAIDYRTPVGLTNDQIVSEISVFPNPVTDYLSVNFSYKIVISDIVITDLTGRTFSGKNSISANHASIDCSGLNPGIYFLTVMTNAGKLTRKFIKQ